MNRVKHLFGQFASFDNLLLAYKKARKGSRRSREAQQYGFHLEKNIFDLRERLRTGKWHPRPFRFFEIYDPKQRTISVATFEDRVVHHALVNVLEPIYERTFIFDSYATRKGKGTHAAVLRAQQMLRQTGWFFKSDVEKYFDSIDHNILLGLIGRKIATYFNSAQNGLSFLGTRIFPGIIRLRPENTRRMFRRLQRLERQFLAGDISDERLLAGANSYLAILSKYPSAGLRKKMLALDLPV